MSDPPMKMPGSSPEEHQNHIDSQEPPAETIRRLARNNIRMRDAISNYLRAFRDLHGAINDELMPTEPTPHAATLRECPDCGGSGTPLGLGTSGMKGEPCETCDGTGFVDPA